MLTLPAAVAGVDVGATLVKVAHRGETPPGFAAHRFPAADLDPVRELLQSLEVRCVAVTGGGGEALEARLEGVEVVRVGEFEAWVRGAAVVAELAGVDLPPEHLLVSVGTGTSVLAVRGGRAERIGGSALGGGTLLGLGRLLLEAGTFTEIAGLAARGDRRRVDLLVGDVYRGGGIALPADLNAASFGKLASTGREDLAAALMGLVGENVAIIAAALARGAGVETIVYCGSPLEENAPLEEILTLATRALGARPLYLPRGAYSGAVGAAALGAQ